MSVGLCGSASTFKFEILDDFGSILAILASTKNSKVAYCVTNSDRFAKRKFSLSRSEILPKSFYFLHVAA